MEAAEPFSRSWRLKAQESRSFRFTIPPNSDSGAGPLRISVETDEEGSRLLAGWTHPMVELEAREYVEIDVARLRDEAAPDQFERIIPGDAEMGQAVVLFKTPVKRKLVVNAFVQDLQTGPTVVFGCPACVNLVSISLTPDPIEGVAGNSKAVNVMAIYNNNVWADVSFSSSYSSSQTVAGTTDYWPFIDLLSAGTSIITATYSECKQVPPLPGEGSGCDCALIQTITRQDTSSVNVIPNVANWATYFGIPQTSREDVVLLETDFNELVANGFISASAGTLVLVNPELWPVLGTAIVIVAAAYLTYEAAQYIAAQLSPKDVLEICMEELVYCLENPWQPDIGFGTTKDCGACFRECKNANGVWPAYKCQTN